jgi:hypothetical protein
MNVDLVINCYEKTYLEIMLPSYWECIVSQNKFNFSKKILLINNVKDLGDAVKMADKLIESGSISKYYIVADYLPIALKVTNLTLEDLGPNRYFSDCALVAATIPENEWFVYWDAEVRLSTSVDWITPCVEYMKLHHDILVANPMWSEGMYGLNRETMYWDGAYSISYAFSDQLFLTKRSYLAQDIYKHSTIASLRYPMAHIHPVFEQNIDAYMRTHALKRLNYSKAQYIHLPGNAGESHLKATPEQMQSREIQSRLMELASNLPPSSPYYNHPAWQVNPRR